MELDSQRFPSGILHGCPILVVKLRKIPQLATFWVQDRRFENHFKANWLETDGTDLFLKIEKLTFPKTSWLCPVNGRAKENHKSILQNEGRLRGLSHLKSAQTQSAPLKKESSSEKGIESPTPPAHQAKAQWKKVIEVSKNYKIQGKAKLAWSPVWLITLKLRASQKRRQPEIEENYIPSMRLLKTVIIVTQSWLCQPQ